MVKPKIRLSVRAVVEMTWHDSDLAPASADARRMQEGAVAHRARQSSAQEKDYRKEVALSADYETDTLQLHITGRADGIFCDEDGITVIEEIKLGVENQPLLPAHRAQAAMYGHMVLCQGETQRVRLRVLYVDGNGNKCAIYEEDPDAEDLRQLFEELCQTVAAWESRKMARRIARDATLKELAFPFATYRASQKRFAQNVYVAIREKKRLFAQAPTGIGKTIAALYPALRALGNGLCTRTVFLTARTTGRKSAMDAMGLLVNHGADVMTVEITAKDKICVQDVRDCRAESCPMARGFYDRLPAALEEGLGLKRLGQEEILQLAKCHQICPFELSLELAVLADVVVCDYNYIFDPMTAMERLMLGGACLLVDEAHQLAPRVRNAYSVCVELEELVRLRREWGKSHGRKNPLYRALTEAIRTLKTLAQNEQLERMNTPPQPLWDAMDHVRECAGEQLAQGGGVAVAESFALAMSYCFVAERFCERYALLADGREHHERVELLLLSADREILEATRRAKGTVFFSATLAPFDACKRMLGSEEGDACLMLPSPFRTEQLQVRIEPIDIRYARREQSVPQVADAIVGELKKQAGNTLIFFPSYAYMMRIAEVIMGMEDMTNETLLFEKRGMREQEKNALMEAFVQGKEENRAVLFAVLGGAFSEGIDLPGSQLEHVIIVSTGLPQPDERVKTMQAYFDNIGEDGYFLCMTWPGMIRVIQAAGRLIRTESDTGTLLLIDSRYKRMEIQRLLKETLVGEALEI